MIRKGDIIEFGYGDRYVVIQVERCRCVDYLTWVDCDGAPCDHDLDCDDTCPLTRDAVPHLHLVCVREDKHRLGKWLRSDMK